MKKINLKKRVRTPEEINKRYFIESSIFAIFFGLLTLMTFNIAALIFTIFCVISAYIFWKRNKNNGLY